jgi:hypothetical protein
VEQKIGVIGVDWISSQPFADGLLLQMKEGQAIHCDFDKAYLDENEEAAKTLVIFRAVIGEKTNPDIWHRIDIRAIVTAQLTKDGNPIGQAGAFEVELMGVGESGVRR